MAKKQSGIELPSTEPVLEQPEPYVPAPIEMDNDALALIAATVFSSAVAGSLTGSEGMSRRQQALEWSVQAAFDIAQAVADKRSA